MSRKRIEARLMSTNTPPEEVTTPPSEGPKTAGEIAMEAYHSDWNSPDWSAIAPDARRRWEHAAQAAITHQESGGDNDALRIPSVDELQSILVDWVNAHQGQGFAGGVSLIRDAMLPIAHHEASKEKEAWTPRFSVGQRVLHVPSGKARVVEAIYCDPLLHWNGYRLDGDPKGVYLDEVLEPYYAGDEQPASQGVGIVLASTGVEPYPNERLNANVGVTVHCGCGSWPADVKVGIAGLRAEIDSWQSRAESAEAQLASLKEEHQKTIIELKYLIETSQKEVLDVASERSSREKAEQERDRLHGWKDQMLTVESWWSKVDEFIRNHPKAPIGQNVSDIALQWLRAYMEEKDKP